MFDAVVTNSTGLDFAFRNRVFDAVVSVSLAEAYSSYESKPYALQESNLALLPPYGEWSKNKSM